MYNLAMQIARFNDISVDEAKTTNSCAGEVKRGRGAEAAETDDENGRSREAVLPGDAYTWDEDLAGIAGSGERRWREE